MERHIGFGWLIIWRRPKESILIGDDTEVSISKIKGQQVWLAVKTPRNVKVIRKEAPLFEPDPPEAA